MRISEDISNHDWISHLIKNGFSKDNPTFWVLEGLVYYMQQEVVASLLKKTAEISAENSQIFVDLCVPILAELIFGPFSRYFKWGLEIDAVPLFFAKNGQNIVSCSFADDYDQGRDVGQQGLIFIHGMRANDIQATTKGVYVAFSSFCRAFKRQKFEKFRLTLRADH